MFEYNVSTKSRLTAFSSGTNNLEKAMHFIFGARPHTRTRAFTLPPLESSKQALLLSYKHGNSYHLFLHFLQFKVVCPSLSFLTASHLFLSGNLQWMHQLCVHFLPPALSSRALSSRTKAICAPLHGQHLGHCGT